MKGIVQIFIECVLEYVSKEIEVLIHLLEERNDLDESSNNELIFLLLIHLN